MRRLRDYVQLDLVQPIELRGKATRYARSELLRVFAIRRMRAEHASLPQIKQKLRAVSERDLEAWLRTTPLPPEAAAALGFNVEVAKSEPEAPSHVVMVQGSSTWQRVPLLPGLELMIAADASQAVLRAAQRVCEEFIPSRSATNTANT